MSKMGFAPSKPVSRACQFPNLHCCCIGSYQAATIQISINRHNLALVLKAKKYQDAENGVAKVMSLEKSNLGTLQIFTLNGIDLLAGVLYHHKKCGQSEWVLRILLHT